MLSARCVTLPPKAAGISSASEGNKDSGRRRRGATSPGLSAQRPPTGLLKELEEVGFSVLSKPEPLLLQASVTNSRKGYHHYVK